ncbi:nuclear RNA export factor 1 isoform X1 [Amyelois transitella]|uniref:nuclear RNA export factor 1 isoform X1 n=2 Tax=Amyelois transitella TaxID=680683 RepID=UPI0029901BBC|nr:nuclear RNA export factor 1 isoform X1 [Amyelois transitella]
MHSKKAQLSNYKKFLLNRVTTSPPIFEYIDSCLARDDEANHYSFHKIMVHNWPTSPEQLFSVLNDYFSIMFIPIQFSSQNGFATFYTSSLSLIQKIMKLDFMFPFERNMYNMDILFNDKSSADCFDNWISIEDIVGSVVSNRLNEKLELDLSNLCNDTEFSQKGLCFYRFNLLSFFKILMLRMGRDTKFLNLSRNNLSQLPMDILNFFIKGNLIGINLSNNNITSLSELQRYSSKIEKIWLEGNPVCEEMDAPTYIRQIMMKFPRVTEIDGVKLNENGLILPFIKNFAVTPDRHTKMLVEKFLSLYFSHFDHSRIRIDKFYNSPASLTITTAFTPEDEKLLPSSFAVDGRNMIKIMDRRLNRKEQEMKLNKKYFNTKKQVIDALYRFPETVHDPTTFCVDVVSKDINHMLLIIDGVFKVTADIPRNVFRFRRTFLFVTTIQNPTTCYFIRNEMLHLDYASPEMIQNSFLQPSRNLYDYALINPDPEEKNIVTNAFCYLTQLRKDEAVSRLKTYDWDIKKALKFFQQELKSDLIPMDKFEMDLDEGHLSDEANMDEVD